MPFCRLKAGEIWEDAEGGHRVGCLDSTDADAVAELVRGSAPTLAIHDQPYNLVAFELFNVEAEYTDIPKILRGYYKEVNGVVTENIERGKSDTIRAGNVWVDIQQVFYRREERRLRQDPLARQADRARRNGVRLCGDAT